MKRPVKTATHDAARLEMLAHRAQHRLTRTMIKEARAIAALQSEIKARIEDMGLAAIMYNADPRWQPEQLIERARQVRQHESLIKAWQRTNERPSCPDCGIPVSSNSLCGHWNCRSARGDTHSITDAYRAWWPVRYEPQQEPYELLTEQEYNRREMVDRQRVFGSYPETKEIKARKVKASYDRDYAINVTD